MAYGGFGRRFLALLIDYVVLWLGAVLLPSGMWVLGAPGYRGLAGIGTLLGDPFYWLAAVVTVAYYVGLESGPWQATLGKKALNLAVSDLAGARIGVLRALGRYFAKFLSALPLGAGFLMVAVHPRKRGLHDLLAGTRVTVGPVEFEPTPQAPELLR